LTGEYLEAREATGSLVKLEPGNRDYLSLYAAAFAGLGQHEQAIALLSLVARRAASVP
jgi:hypothetical protein